MKNTKLKIVTLVTLLVCTIALGFSSSLALYKYESDDTATLTTMTTSIVLNEEYATTTPTYSVTSKSTDTVLVRMIIFPTLEIENKDGGWDAYAGIPTSNLTYNLNLNGSWKEYNGYYYYALPLEAGKTTPKIVINNIQLLTTGVDNGSYETWNFPTKVVDEDGTVRQVRIRFYVSAEAVQSSNLEYQKNWNLTENDYRAIYGDLNYMD